MKKSADDEQGGFLVKKKGKKEKKEKNKGKKNKKRIKKKKQRQIEKKLNDLTQITLTRYYRC